MKLPKVVASALVGAVSLVPCAGALAHIGVPETGTAGKSQYVTFQVGHGCGKSDTVSLEISIPPEVLTAKPIPGFFGFAEVTRDATDRVEKITFSKTDARETDDHIYEVRVRVSVPDAPFTTLYFSTVQRCRSADNVESLNQWIAYPGGPAVNEEEGIEDAPHLNVLPVRSKGWNKFTVSEEITDLSLFADAEIVWSGESAYSANPTTAELIEGEEGVTVLASIDADSVIWVKY